MERATRQARRLQSPGRSCGRRRSQTCARASAACRPSMQAARRSTSYARRRARRGRRRRPSWRLVWTAACCPRGPPWARWSRRAPPGAHHARRPRVCLRRTARCQLQRAAWLDRQAPHLMQTAHPAKGAAARTSCRTAQPGEWQARRLLSHEGSSATRNGAHARHSVAGAGGRLPALPGGAARGRARRGRARAGRRAGRVGAAPACAALHQPACAHARGGRGCALSRLAGFQRALLCRQQKACLLPRQPRGVSIRCQMCVSFSCHNMPDTTGGEMHRKHHMFECCLVTVSGCPGRGCA